MQPALENKHILVTQSDTFMGPGFNCVHSRFICFPGIQRISGSVHPGIPARSPRASNSELVSERQ